MFLWIWAQRESRVGCGITSRLWGWTESLEGAMTWNARLVQIQITLVFYLEEALSLYGGRPLRSHHPEIAEEENAILAYKQADIAKQKKRLCLSAQTICNQTNVPKYQNSYPHQNVWQKFQEPDCTMHCRSIWPAQSGLTSLSNVHDLDPRLNVKHRTSYSRQVRREGKIVKRRAREHVRKAVTLSYAANVDMWRSIADPDNPQPVQLLLLY